MLKSNFITYLIHFSFNKYQFIVIVLGGSLTKIAYYSTESFRRVYYATDNLEKNDAENKDDV